MFRNCVWSWLSAAAGLQLTPFEELG
jgi:hypothetical protein